MSSEETPKQSRTPKAKIPGDGGWKAVHAHMKRQSSANLPLRGNLYYILQMSELGDLLDIPKEYTELSDGNSQNRDKKEYCAAILDNAEVIYNDLVTQRLGLFATDDPEAIESKGNHSIGSIASRLYEIQTALKDKNKPDQKWASGGTEPSNVDIATMRDELEDLQKRCPKAPPPEHQKAKGETIKPKRIEPSGNPMTNKQILDALNTQKNAIIYKLELGARTAEVRDAVADFIQKMKEDVEDRVKAKGAERTSNPRIGGR